jgi:hypothetical protein
MGSRTSPYCYEPTTALRARSINVLTESLRDYMVRAEPDVAEPRDVMVGFAPYFDCAQRIGFDPVALFDDAATDLGSAMKDLAHMFCRRSDVTIEAFGWKVEDRADGPCYRPAEMGLAWQSRRSTRTPGNA